MSRSESGDHPPPGATYGPECDRGELERQLREAQKMAALGLLAAGVAHDFNNLLTVILAAAELLLQTTDVSDPGHEDLEDIVAATLRGADLTRQLLAVSRRRVAEPRTIDLNAVVASVSRLLGRVIGEDVELRADLTAECWTVRADPGQLEQVLINLAMNARDAMPRGGTLRLRTDNVVVVDGDRARGLPDLEPGEYVALAVEDTGVGIAPTDRAQIFDPLYTTKSSPEHLGLGLATVADIARQSGGHVFVESEPDKGSTFTVLLPRCADDRLESGELALEGAPRGTERILVVEDDAAVRVVVTRTLRHLGYRVSEAANGAEAIGLLSALPYRIDLVISDVVLPEMHGPAVEAWAAESGHPVRVLYMSGYPDEHLRARGLGDRNVIPLRKPFGAATLAEAVRARLDGVG